MADFEEDCACEPAAAKQPGYNAQRIFRGKVPHTLPPRCPRSSICTRPLHWTLRCNQTTLSPVDKTKIGKPVELGLQPLCCPRSSICTQPLQMAPQWRRNITSYVFSLLTHTKPKSTDHLHSAYVKNSNIRCKPFILVWTIHDGGLSCDKQNMSWKSFISFQLQCWKWKKEKENKPCRTPVSAKLARRAILPLLCVCWGILALVWSIRNA